MRLRPRHRPGRADHHHGADRRQAPFLYFPLGHHFEQDFHVRHRPDRYSVGQCMGYVTTDPDLITELAGKSVSYRDIETDGTARAARPIAELV